MQTFEQKVRSMSAKEIIMAMVEALTHPPIINIDMRTFGEVRIKKSLFGLFKKKICYGCAATNTICQIAGIKFNTSSIYNCSTRSSAVNSGYSFLSAFEDAIDCLRKGDIYTYNGIAQHLNIAEITCPGNYIVPFLSNDYTNEDLKPYIELANAQP